MGLTIDDARAIAFALPEVTEEPHHDLGSFRVRGKIFATIPDGDTLRVMVDEDGIREAVAVAPASCSEVWWGKRLAAVAVDLRTVDADLVGELLTDAWRRKAPRALVRQVDAESGTGEP